MIRKLSHSIIVDNASRFHSPDSACVGRRRTLKIRFRSLGERGHEVHAWGDERLPELSQANIGVLRADGRRVRGWIQDLFRVWHDSVIGWSDPSDGRPWADRRKPFADHVNLRRAASEQQLNEMWRRIAVAGRKLFVQLFFEGDERLKALGRALTEVLWNGEHVVTVISNDVIVPWSMLYVPRPGTLSELDSELRVDRTAFLGYRHLVEHVFEVPRDPRPAIHYTRLAATAYLDERLDRHPAPIIAPVLAQLDRHAAVHYATSIREAEERLRGAGADDHLIYFCCHCEADGDAVCVRLTDGEAITPGDIEAWLAMGKGMTGNPFVMLNTCHGGDFGAHPPSHFGSVLLQSGVSSLLGPAVSIPAPFAGAFAEEFFSLALASKQYFGWAVRALAQRYVDSDHNPLGLSYSLFHGIDGHFCPVEAST